MSKDSFNDLPTILQDASFQNLIAEQKRINTISQVIAPQIKANEYLAMATQIKQTVSNELTTIMPILQWVSQTQNLQNIANTIVEQMQIIKTIDIQGINSILRAGAIGIAESVRLLHLYPDDTSEEDIVEVEEVNTKILNNIFNTEDESNSTEGSVIVLSPINDSVLKYLAENPQAMYQLSSDDFEMVMAEIYTKLGYKVERTQSTRDGGKDIIIRKPEVLGDFIYYVECKRYAANRPVGVGIVRSLSGTISADRVNGGILATTSYFTRDARKFVSDYNLQYQIKMQDYNEIQNLLNRIV